MCIRDSISDGQSDDAPIHSMSLLSPVLANGGELRNLAIVSSHQLSCVNFFDIVTQKIYHQIKTSAPVVLIAANEHVVAIAQSGNTISLYSASSLEELRTVYCSSPNFSLGERWLAYTSNKEPEEGKVGAVATHKSSSSIVTSTITTFSAMTQDAFDNIVKAIGGEEVSRENFLGSSPIGSRKNAAKSCYISIIDVVSGESICCFEASQNELSRPVEYISFSSCGTKLVVSVGNGHCVDIYRYIGGVAGFVPELTLNRGMTPAKIVCVSFTNFFAAICSSNGTVHIYAANGENVGKIKKIVNDTCPKVVLMNQAIASDLLLVLTSTGVVELVSLTNGGIGESSRLDLLKISDGKITAAKIPSPMVEECPVFETCAPLAVPFQSSPNFSWPTNNMNDQFTAKYINCSSFPNCEVVLKAMATDLLTQEREELARDRYQEQIGREGFVQILETL